jgi:hypothetical protein
MGKKVSKSIRRGDWTERRGDKSHGNNSNAMAKLFKMKV